jgi:hypothetical protein
MGSDVRSGREIARSTPGLVYATSVALSSSGSTLLRSADSGMTWMSTAIPAAPETEPRIMAIDPVDAKFVYLCFVGALSDSIVITTDGTADAATPAGGKSGSCDSVPGEPEAAIFLGGVVLLAMFRRRAAAQ